MLSLNAVCNEIIRKFIATNQKITPLKLQKMLYLIYAYSLKENKGKKIFAASFHAWEYGPVCVSVYEEFSSFGSNPITSYYKDAKGRSYFPNRDIYENYPFFVAFNTVWNKYARKTGSQLVDITHGNHNTAWFKTRTNGLITDNLILDDVKRGIY